MRKPRSKVTARDVAKLVGVSPSTVSRVLSHTDVGLISQTTRNKVLEAASRLGYTPNPIAQALRGKRSHLIGVVVRDIADPFFSKLIAHLTQQARALNYRIVLGHVETNAPLHMDDVLDIRHTDGVILLGSLKGLEAALESMLEGKHPIVALCRPPTDALLHCIDIDNTIGATALLDHLRGLGHAQIAFIDGGWQGDILERREAYVAYLQQHGLPLNPEWIQAEDNTLAGGYRAMQRLLALSERPSAVFASDDIVAIGALKATLDAGLTVPGDLSIVGYDDIEIARFVTPALTTMRQPLESMSQQALQLMLELIGSEDEARGITHIRIEPELVIRESSGVARTGQQKAQN